jgi:anti-repressor protein
MQQQLIPVTPLTVGTETIPTIDARTLHAFVESKRKFSDWIKERIELYDFTENADYVVHKFVTQYNQVDRLDYALTLDMAKEITMVERNAKGKEARQYFLECERQAKAHAESPEQIMARALRIADANMKKQVEYIAVLEPKAEFFDAVANSSSLILIREAAKILAVPHMGQNMLYNILRGLKVLMKNNEPYQTYVNSGYFMVRERQYTIKGEVKVSRTTMVTQKGLDFIRRLAVKNMKGGFFKKGPAVWEMPEEFMLTP